MKKILYSTLIALAGLFAASCEQEHIEAIYNPQNVTPQTLSSFQGCALAEDGAAVTASFQKADFGGDFATVYTLFYDMDPSFPNPSKMSATISDGTISIAQKTLNSIILNAGGMAGEPFLLYFKLVGYLANDKGSAIESTSVESNVTFAEFIPYDADLLDVDKYPHIWIIGAHEKVGAWSHDKVHQFLYDYDGTGVYTGMIDYGDNAAGGWKLTGIAGWDDSCNWGSLAQDEAAEVASITLVSAGSSKDIKCYSKRFYKWSFTPASMTLNLMFGFDNVGIVGAFNGWDPADANMKMNYNEYYHRFYIDQTFAEDTELKFTCDDAWDMNWGTNMEPGGPNIPVSAGSYRIYLDFNKMEYSFSTSMFGQEEPGSTDTPEPPVVETYKGWGMIGSFNDWGGDVEMTESAGVWTGYINLTADAEWKLRKDAGWDENVGGTFVALGEPFAAEAGGANIAIGVAGFYKVVYDTNAQTITVSNGEVWSLIGGFNDWSGDVDMVEVDGKWVSPATQISGEFKLRKNHAWDENRGGTLVNLGEAFSAVPGGDNIKVDDGLYKVTYNPADETIVVEPGKPENLWSIIGSVAGTSWDTDFYMTKSGDEWVYEGLEIAEGNEFKIRFNNDWGVNRGGAFVALKEAFEVSQDGPNIAGVPAGTYNVTYNPAAETITIAEPQTGWSVIGNFNGWADDAVMTEVVPGIWVSDVLELSAGWKIRFNKDWAVNCGSDQLTAQGVFAKGVQDGSNVELAGTFKVVYNANNGTLGTLGWGVVGSIASLGFGWAQDLPLNLASDGKWYSVPFVAAAGDEFKIRKNADWAENFGGTLAAIGEAFEAVPGGDNIKITEETAGTYMVVYDPEAGTITLTKEYWALIGDFNGWSGDVFMMYAGDGKWAAYGQTLPGGWKVRKSCGWDDNRGGAFATSGEAFEAVPGGDNINTGNDKVDIVYDSANEKFTVTK